ncbi:exported hypothetical protein [Candidatus Zixiibacteriota bacterium]|nr:exported hypothetical protein [candidate division Zixibacteria bacterium]
MIKGKWICLFLTLIVSFAVSAVTASELTEKELINKVIVLYQLDTGNIAISVRRMPNIPQASDYDSVAIKLSANLPSNDLTTIPVIFLRRGEPILESRMQLKITRFDNVLVATSDIRRNENITDQNCRLERADITGLTEVPLSDISQLPGKWSKRYIRKGQILTSGMVEEIPTVLSGQPISILYRSSTFEISARGKALQSGYSGEKIRVQNIQSNKIISGTVVDDRTVSVEGL